ncbi:hypothetical protein AU195_04535 [Mycobacterium sp. IS-1496]|uniref:hypothetical protein n=1 Tax=Mycobacterium sp. IS-1496 TaxID=1772284 RepID=UPI0007415C77|nr:hypothetical protein [Mycobacterium sp. IS-1496]KUI36128.1 hypothetical protein AU195_04535 [Mycobacterium sp. IS-1496]
MANYSSLPPLPFGIGRPDAGDLARELKFSLQEDYRSDADTSDVRVLGVHLTWKEGRQYEGFASVQRQGKESENVNVYVLTDGEGVGVYRSSPMMPDLSTMGF